jgi:hypothetical protein
MIYSKYVKDMVKLIETETERLGHTEVKEAYETIEDAPAFTGKVWIEDILDKVYTEKFQ